MSAMGTSTRARPLVCLLTLAVVSLSACSSTPGDAPSQPRALDAAGLTALDNYHAVNTLAATPEGQAPVLALLNATLPKPAAAGMISSEDVDAALHFTAKLVAATQLDQAVFCGSDANRKAALKKFGTDGLNAAIDDPRNAVSVKITAPVLADLMSKSASCAEFRLVGPGVALGPQHWTVRPDDRGNRLSIDYVGTSTMLFADAAGHVTPVSKEHRVRYSLTNASGVPWALVGWSSNARSLLRSIVDQVPVPSAYMPALATGTLRGDSKALTTVRAAMAQWAGSASAVVISRVTSKSDFDKASPSGRPAPSPSMDPNTGITRRTLPDGSREGTMSELVAPSRGDSRQAGSGPVRGFSIRRGAEGYSLADPSKTRTPVPFTHGNAKAHWVHYVTGGLGGGSLAPGNSWDWYDLLTTAEAAAPTPCPALFSDAASRPAGATDTSAAACYAVSVRTGPGVRLTSVGSTLALMASSGRQVLTFTVALDHTGRLTQATASAEQVSFGQRGVQTTSHSWFPKPTAVAPGAPQLPAAADTAQSGDFSLGAA